MDNRKILVTTILAAIITSMLLTAGCEKTEPQSEQEEKVVSEPKQESTLKAEEAKSNVKDEPTDKVESKAVLQKPTIKLTDVINSARTWGPTNQSWYGKMAPDFTLTDITGKKHKLSDYRGKDVLLVFWATWCGPCRMEVPHLIELRDTISKDKLAIFAISYINPMNTTEMVKNFVQQNKKINYTVFSSDARNMPAPFDSIEYIPCSFFINANGKIKLATSGLVSLAEIKAILQAE